MNDTNLISSGELIAKLKDNEDELLTKAEATKVLKLKDERTIDRWVKRGILKAYRCNGVVRLVKSEVVAVFKNY